MGRKPPLGSGKSAILASTSKTCTALNKIVKVIRMLKMGRMLANLKVKLRRKMILVTILTT